MLTRVVLVAALAVLAVSCGGSHDGKRGRAQLEIYDFEHDFAPAASHPGRRTVTCTRFCPRAVSGRVTLAVLHGPEVTDRDLDPASVRVMTDPSAGGNVVVAVFTATGRRKFRALTRTLAHRGRVQSNAQHFAIVVGSRVLSAPLIDYLNNPDGIDAPGIEVSGLGSRAAAARLAKRLRSSG